MLYHRGGGSARGGQLTYSNLYHRKRYLRRMGTRPIFPPLEPQLLQYIRTQPETPVYHYTSLASLLSIVESRQIWSSHFASLNDDAEFRYALELVYQLCQQMLKSGAMPWNTHLGYFLDNFSRLSRPDLFVFSFSEMPDLLSQWRAYAPGGDGVSIGLDPESVINLANNNSASLVKCVYDPHTQRE